MTRKRRGRGEGSVYQRADGIWIASVCLGYDAEGKRQRLVAGGITKRAALDNLKRLQESAGRGIVAEGRQLTVGQYLARWLEIVKPTVEPNTYDPYERHVRLHLAPHLGHIKLAQLAALHVKELYATLTGKGVSAALQRKVGTTLTIALNEAVDPLKLLPYNPAAGVRKPKASKPEIHPLDPDQVGRFLQAADPDRLSAFYAVALDSGARLGELFALHWPDVDFDRGFITIRRSLEEINGRHRLKDVKTKRANRRVRLAASTLAALNGHRQRMLAEGRDVREGVVFCDTQGGFLRESNFRRDSFLPILARAGLPRVRLYDLRHTCATLLLLADVNVKVVSERLGHASVQLTLDTYSHVLPSMQERAAEKMDLILGRRPPTQVGT
jgi:integrase